MEKTSKLGGNIDAAPPPPPALSPFPYTHIHIIVQRSYSVRLNKFVKVTDFAAVLTPTPDVSEAPRSYCL